MQKHLKSLVKPRQHRGHVPLTITQAQEYFSIVANPNLSSESEFCHGTDSWRSDVLNTVSFLMLCKVKLRFMPPTHELCSDIVSITTSVVVLVAIEGF